VIAINSAVALTTRVGTTGVEWDVAIPFTIAGLLGVSVGKALADRLPTITLVRWFVGLLVVSFDENRVDITTRLGTTEDWIIHKTSPMDHSSTSTFGPSA
jgi:hypothetical protein